jgi:hypothetical protein
MIIIKSAFWSALGGLALLIFVAGWTGASIQDPGQAKPVKPDRDSCLTDKDHTACKRFYRAGCLNKDPDACNSYAKELAADCGAPPGPGAKLEQFQNFLACGRKTQCWQDRSIALAQMKDVCSADPNSSACKVTKDRVASVSVRVCDGTASVAPPSF